MALALAGRALAQEAKGADADADAGADDADAGADADADVDADADAGADVDADADAGADADVDADAGAPAHRRRPAAPVVTIPPEEPERRSWLTFAPTDVFFATAIGPRVLVSSTPMVSPSDTGVRSTLHLLPRVSLGEHLQLRLRFSVGYEWTPSPAPRAKQEAEISDLVPSLWFPSIPTIPVVGIKPVVAVQVGLPTSAVSRAKTMYVAPAVVLQFVRDSRGAGSKDGSLRFVLNASFVHPFYQYPTPSAPIAPLPYAPYGESVAAAPYPTADSCFAFGGQADNPDATCGISAGGYGLASIENLFGLSLAVIGRWWRLSPGASVLLNNAWVFTFADPPGIAPAPGDRSSNHRASAIASTWLDFEIAPWLTAEMGAQIAGGMLGSLGSLGTSPDYRLYGALNLGLDRLVDALTASPRRASPAPE